MCPQYSEPWKAFHSFLSPNISNLGLRGTHFGKSTPVDELIDKNDPKARNRQKECCVSFRGCWALCACVWLSVCLDTPHRQSLTRKEPIGMKIDARSMPVRFG